MDYNKQLEIDVDGGEFIDCNDHGTTTDTDASDGCECSCNDGFTGTVCDTPPAVVLVPVAVGGAGVICVIVLYFFCCRLRLQDGHFMFLRHYKKEARVEATLLHPEINSRLGSSKYRGKPRFREPILHDELNSRLPVALGASQNDVEFVAMGNIGP